MTSEFDLIRRHFTWPVRHADLGGGDDAALFRLAPGKQAAVSSDMLVAGRHFFPDADPEALGWKTLAVNISDLAAMAAQPRWALLSLALPRVDEPWIAAFARGLRDCAERFGVDLIGGDTTRGPLTLNVTIIGEVDTGTAVRRDGARDGDMLWISGQPGRAALGLWHLRDELVLPVPARSECLQALHRPQPRVALGQALRGLASAMLDVSDGLLGDLGHILECSGVGALIEAQRLPLAALEQACGEASTARRACLGGGDDYELLFAAPPAHTEAVLEAARSAGTPVHRIGRITTAAEGLALLQPDGQRQSLAARGFDHFATDD
jgi:thiamine-monophosphate kinase